MRLMIIHPFCEAQIVLLSIEITVPLVYSDFANVFLKDSIAKLSETPNIKNYAINLLDDKQPLYGRIYSLRPVELETLKTYIRTNLADGFIRPFTSPAGLLILLVNKDNKSLCLYVDYLGVNNGPQRQWIENRLWDKMRSFLVPGHAFWPIQRFKQLFRLH